jgi:hypothetical protein
MAVTTINALPTPSLIQNTLVHRRAVKAYLTPQSRVTPAKQDNITISAEGRQALTADSAVRANAKFQRSMAELTAGQNFLRRSALANPQSADIEQFAYDLAHNRLSDGQGGGGLISLGATPNDPLHYTSGEPVTEESKDYFTQQATQYRQAASKLYDSAKAAGASAGKIVNRVFDLQAQQPARFRAMMMWPPAG